MKFFSSPVPEHDEVPLSDDGQWEELVDDWESRDSDEADEKAVYVVSVGEDRDPVVRQAQLAEILALVEAQGGLIVGHEVVYLTKVRPRTLLGKGTSRAIADRARDLGAGMLVLDAELSPSQTVFAGWGSTWTSRWVVSQAAGVLVKPRQSFWPVNSTTVWSNCAKRSRR